MARERESTWKDQRLDPDVYGGAPALKPETIRPHTGTVITVADVDNVTLNDPEHPDGERQAIVVRSEEFPDHAFWLNKSGTRTCIEKLGDLPRKWVGERIPLVVVRVNNPRTRTSQNTLNVAPPGDWSEMFSEFDGKPARRMRGVKKATKRGRQKK